MKRLMGGWIVVLVSCLIVATATTGAAGAQGESPGAAPADSGKAGASDVYLVLLDEAPAGAYAGGIAGYPATKPAAGKRFNKKDAKVQRYVNYLRSRHAQVANSVGATREYDYEYSLNAFAATLTKAQLAKLRTTPGVVSIQRDKLSQVKTDNTPTFLGLNAAGGLWSQLGGQGSAGDGVIIGVVDTGIWPEHPSFAAAGYGPVPAGWNGTCQSGQLWSQQHCTNKLIGARYFHKGFGHFGGSLKDDYISARDHDGHGTHTTSTAGGNGGVNASIFGRSFGTVSGMAPRARVAAYKACWPGGCATTDLVSAIDSAVGDGVDVINYSIGDDDPDFLDADDVAFLFARQAGVFVAASAGNSGPGPSTVDHGGPWLTTVGASTQNRSFVGTATLGSGATFQGASVTPGLAATPLVDGAAAGNEGCLSGLSPAVVTGKIVLCKGSFSRAARSLGVKNAGGVGMILYTVDQSDALLSDNHYVPAVHIRNSDGLAIKAYIAATSAPTAALSGGAKAFGGGNTMAAFSSRGPLVDSARSTGDLLKPDVTAPGVQILAGNTPTAFVGAPGQLFQAIAGTSMSSPHVAGIGALLRDRHPGWTPDMMQSALMTSARQDVLKEDGSTPADPFDFGAGHIVPNSAADPGLVYPAGFDDYRAFLRSQGLCTLCFGTTPAPVIAATDFNAATITVRALAGVRTVTRTVRNVGPAGTYTVSVAAPPGVDVVVNPSVLTLGPGATASYQVTFTSTADADFDEYSFGALTWSDGAGHSVRSPLVIRPVIIAAPASAAGTGATGSLQYAVKFGYSGSFNVAPQGLVAATTETRTIVDDPANDFNANAPDTNQGIQVHEFAVPSGTPLLRVQLFDEFTDGNDDIDLFLYRVGAGGVLTLVGASFTTTSAELIDVAKPGAGTYRLYAHGFETDGADAVYTLFRWLVPSTATGNMTATSSTATATIGGSADITVSWTGLTPATKYLGRVSYSNGSAEIGGTVVTVNP
ncbi:S8 family serine peptidase [Kribbella sp. NPDC056345]|uniref:S8 family serine peptidase n=1 Tax=Kribbella sp. NPDC056345 TaxID=3345789 RepID=UPI0035DA88DB